MQDRDYTFTWFALNQPLDADLFSGKNISDANVLIENLRSEKDPNSTKGKPDQD